MERSDFTDRSLKILSLAKEEAIKSRCSHIGVEHLILGLLIGGGITVTEFMRLLEATPEEAEAQWRRAFE